MTKIKISNSNFTIGFIVVFALLSLFIFGFNNTKILLAFLLFSLPIYFILSRFNLDSTEKVALSFFAALGIFPSLVYLLAFVVGSIRAATAIVVIVLLIAAFFIRKIKK